MKKIVFILWITLGLFHSKGYAQEVNFGQYATEEIILTNVSSNSSLDFGTVLRNGGLYQIQLTDPEVVVFSIQAEYDKDLFVTLTPPAELVLDASNSIPFTLRAAYANQGNNNIAQAKIISGNTARFPVQARGSRPPGPPPTPKHEGYTTPTATAYLYIYGDINVGNVSAGFYSGIIDITVSYE
ncbi:MAG: hypothetical protein R3224_09210 [Balneolaceae bacterium]|nr:hypothetical protein [Balneolaceae bacterium]